MISESQAADDPFDEDVTAQDAAAYIHQIANEMAKMAARTGLENVATALFLARDLAERAMLEARYASQTNPGKPAPEEAA